MSTTTLTKTISQMSTVEIRKAVHSYIDQLDDNFLQVVYSMMETYMRQYQMPDISEKIEGVPSTDDEIMASIEKGEEQLEKGEYYTVEELKAKTAQWFSTK